MKATLYLSIAILHTINGWARQHLKEIVIVTVLSLFLAFLWYSHHTAVTAPVVTRVDCGLILDIDDVGPDSQQSKIRTDKMIALTNLKFSTSIVSGSRLYYIEHSSGHKGWEIAP